MYNDAISLINVTKTVGSYGDPVEVETVRTVFARLKSIGQSEFYQAAGVGLKPEMKFVLPDFLEYHGEQIVEYRQFGEHEASRYTVLRTYRDNNELELVVKRGVDR